MKILSLSLLISGLCFSALFGAEPASKTVLKPKEIGNTVRIFRGDSYYQITETRGGFKENSLELLAGSYTRVITLDRKFGPAGQIDAPYCVPLSVNRPGNILALIKVEGRMDMDLSQYGKVAFAVAGKKELLPSMAPLRDVEDGSWLLDGQFFAKGKLISFKSNDQLEEKKLGSFSGMVSADGVWRVFASKRILDNGMAAYGVELNNLKNNDVVPVAEVTAPDDGVPVAQFSRDGKLMYYRTKQNPAIHALASGQDKIIDAVTFKQPWCFGFYIDDPQYVYFWDFFSLIVLSAKDFSSVKEAPTIISPETVDILSSRDTEVFGVSRQKADQSRGPLKDLFRYNWKKGIQRIVPLPPQTVQVFMDGERADVFFMQQGNLQAMTMEIKE